MGIKLTVLISNDVDTLQPDLKVVWGLAVVLGRHRLALIIAVRVLRRNDHLARVHERGMALLCRCVSCWSSRSIACSLDSEMPAECRATCLPSHSQEDAWSTEETANRLIR
jgi:hypothetical protein